MSTIYTTIFNYACEQYGHNDLSKMTHKLYDGDPTAIDSQILVEAKLDLNLSVEFTRILKKMDSNMYALNFIYSKYWDIGATTLGITNEGFHGVTFNTLYFNNQLQRKYILLHEARHCYQNQINMCNNTEISELDADIYALTELDNNELVREFVVTNLAIKGFNFKNNKDLLTNLNTRLALLQN